jgi:Tol biopolymer transport system component
MKPAIVLATLALGIALCASSSQASAPRPIVFAADRAAAVSGEIYRLDPNGHLVDLSKSPYEDIVPAVSSNGKRVAFIRERGNSAHVYEVGINGHGPIRFAPVLPSERVSGCTPALAWQPGGNRLAAGACGGNGSKLWILQPRRKPILVSGAGLSPSWSPDGRLLIGSTPAPDGQSTAHAFSPAGEPLWHAPGEAWSAAWSSTNLLALPSVDGLAVYDESGREMLSETGRVFGGPAWSPNGRLLAFIIGHRLEVRTPFGEGVLLDKRISGPHGLLIWDGNDHVIVDGFGSCECKAKSVDVNTGQYSPASKRWFAPLSPNRRLAAFIVQSGYGFDLEVAPPAGGAGKTYLHLPPGYDDGRIAPVSALEFVDSTRSLVYASYNPEPFSNLYTVDPSGGTPHELDTVEPYAFQPELSPDGTKIAYTWAPYVGLTCKGCASEIRVANADGTGMQALTTPGDCTFDDSPSWSPDGQTILYSETGCDNPGELYTIPATGGTPHDLGVAGIAAAWGPTKIAYAGALDTSGGIWTADPDGSNPTKVADKGGDPAWSETGTLAYLVGASTAKIGQTAVHLPFASVSSLAWSPDGSRFVVVARKTKTGFDDVYTVKTDGTDPVRLTRYYDASSAGD